MVSYPHPICIPCYYARTGIALRPNTGGALERCCWCGEVTGSGVYVRGGPSATACADPTHGDEAGRSV